MEALQTIRADGHRIFRFGGEQAWKVKQVGDYIVSLEWFGANTRQVDAVVVIWSARQGLDAGAWVVARKRMFDYCDEHNRPKPYAFDEAFHALVAMGRYPLRMEVNKLVGLLMDQIDDLAHVPIASTETRKRIAGGAIWEVEHRDTNTGKTLRESAI